MVKYAQYGFKSLEKYALQTLAVVQEFVVMKVFHSMYYETQDYKARDMSAFKEDCDSYMADTGFFNAGGSLEEIVSWMQFYQKQLIAYHAPISSNPQLCWIQGLSITLN